MRDPARIYKFCNELARHWSKVPDWRFGQLLANVLGQEMPKGRDIFFPEEDEMMSYFDKFFEAWSGVKGGEIVNNHMDINKK